MKTESLALGVRFTKDGPPGSEPTSIGPVKKKKHAVVTPKPSSTSSPRSMVPVKLVLRMTSAERPMSAPTLSRVPSPSRTSP